MACAMGGSKHGRSSRPELCKHGLSGRRGRRQCCWLHLGSKALRGACALERVLTLSEPHNRFNGHLRVHARPSPGPSFGSFIILSTCSNLIRTRASVTLRSLCARVSSRFINCCMDAWRNLNVDTVQRKHSEIFCRTKCLVQLARLHARHAMTHGRAPLFREAKVQSPRQENLVLSWRSLTFSGTYELGRLPENVVSR